MTIDDNSAQLAPWEDEELVDSIRVGRRDSDHYADKIWVGVVELSLNDLLAALKRDVGKLSNIQLPRVSRDRFYLNQGVPTEGVDRNDVYDGTFPVNVVAMNPRRDSSAATMYSPVCLVR